MFPFLKSCLLKVGHRLTGTFSLFFNCHDHSIKHSRCTAIVMKVLQWKPYIEECKFVSSYSSCHIGLKAVFILYRRSDISPNILVFCLLTGGFFEFFCLFLMEITASCWKRWVISIQEHEMRCAFPSISDEFPETHRASIRQDHEGRFYEDFYKYVFLPVLFTSCPTVFIQPDAPFCAFLYSLLIPSHFPSWFPFMGLTRLCFF